MISSPGPGHEPADPAGPGPGQPPEGPARPAGVPPAPPWPGPAAPRARRPRPVLIMLGVLAAVLVVVPVLWFVAVLVVWSLAGGDASPPAGPGSAGPAGGAPIAQVMFSPDGTLAASVTVSASSNASRVTVSGTATGKMITAVTDRHGIDAAAISPDDTILAILDVDGTTYLRDITTGQLTGILPAPAGNAERGQTVAFGPDGKILAVADASSAIYLWDTATRQMTASYTYPGAGSILGLTFSPDGKTLAIYDNNNHTYVLASATGQPVAALTNSYMSGGPNAVAYSHDSKYLATCTQDGPSVWDIATSSRTATQKNPDGCQAAAFSPDGTILATGDSNGRIYLRDIATGRTITQLAIPGGVQILRLAVSHGATTLSAGYLTGHDGPRTRHWTISPQA